MSYANCAARVANSYCICHQACFLFTLSKMWKSVFRNLFVLFTELVFRCMSRNVDVINLTFKAKSYLPPVCCSKTDLSYVPSSCVGLSIYSPLGGCHILKTHKHIFIFFPFSSPQLTTAEYVCSWVRMTTLMLA